MPPAWDFETENCTPEWMTLTIIRIVLFCGGSEIDSGRSLANPSVPVVPIFPIVGFLKPPPVYRVRTMVQRNYLPIISIALAFWFCLFGQPVVGQQSFDASTSRAKHACVTPHKLTRQVETRAHVVANAGRFLPKAVANQPTNYAIESENQQRSVRPAKAAMTTSGELAVPKFEGEDSVSGNKIDEVKKEQSQPLMPGLNTRSDSVTPDMDSSNVNNASLGIESSGHHDNPMLHHKQVDFVCQKDLACASPRLSRLPENVFVGQRAMPRADSEPDRSSMLQPLVPVATKLPKRHEIRIESTDTDLEPAADEVEHIVTTVQLTDGEGAFAYSSINTQEETASIQEPVQLQQHPGPMAELQGLRTEPATALNFSDTPAVPAASFAFDTRQALQASATTANSGLVVHPPMLQPYNANQFTFVVENRSPITVRDVAIELSVSDNSKIIAALPGNSVSSDSQAIFKFDEIAAGDRVQLHVNAISRDGEAIEFAANVVTRSTYDFAVRDSKEEGRLAKVSHRLSDFDPPAINSTEQPVEQPATGGPRLVRNPFFQNRQQSAQPAGNRTYRH